MGTSPQYSTSAALLFTEQELGGPCVENESYPAVSGTFAQVVLGNGDRVGLIIVNFGAVDVFVGTQPAPGINGGIQLGANGGNISTSVRDDFTLPSRNWYAQTQGGSSTLYILEIIRFTSLSLTQSGGD